jgi:hypothetical protein
MSPLLLHPNSEMEGKTGRVRLRIQTKLDGVWLELSCGYGIFVDKECFKVAVVENKTG